MKRRSIGICWQGPVTKELSQSIASSPSDFVHVVSTWKDKNWELYGEKVLEALRAKETIAGGCIWPRTCHYEKPIVVGRFQEHSSAKNYHGCRARKAGRHGSGLFLEDSLRF